ncbi:MAG: hypothetical protein COY81_02830 [Candidatus Pacebacteria bacterium CG_4_10_14_0_8_um_filter_43_12]|nr:MAG: hypothetical protein COY81_02830 [Candidatus Pacebacteria bacterium CG_4_10_14_0_8_um_filter_43_12]
MSLSDWLLELFFPRWCCHCGSYGELLCADCFNQIEFSVEIVKTENLDSLSSLTVFNAIGRDLIHALKYASVKQVAITCARMMYLYGKIPEVDILTAVPLHPHRQAQRGFNQAKEIAIELARLLKLPYLEITERVVHTTNLAKVSSRQQRAKTIQGQFRLREFDHTLLVNKRVLIIDDVWTTGATLQEVALTIKKLPVVNIAGFVFAHET